MYDVRVVCAAKHFPLFSRKLVRSKIGTKCAPGGILERMVKPLLGICCFPDLFCSSSIVPTDGTVLCAPAVVLYLVYCRVDDR